MKEIRLETDRLLLRPPRGEDIDAYAELCADPEVMKFLLGPMTRLEAWRHLAMLIGHWEIRGYGMFAVIEKESGRFVGRVGFLDPDGWPGFELGWTLARSAQGQGYATEAARACLDHAFDTLGRERVISLIREDNPRSIAVATRLGYHLDGTTDLMGQEVRVYAIEGR